MKVREVHPKSDFMPFQCAIICVIYLTFSGRRMSKTGFGIFAVVLLLVGVWRGVHGRVLCEASPEVKPGDWDAACQRQGVRQAAEGH